MKLPNYIEPIFFENIVKKNGIMLDTNMMLLYLAGLSNNGKIKNLPRLKEYNDNDFLYIAALIKKSKQKNMYITPQSIIETLYLLGIDPRRKEKEMNSVRRLEEVVPNLAEDVMSVLSAANEKDIYIDTPAIINTNKMWRIKKYGIPDLSFEKSLLEKELAFLSSDDEYVSELYQKGICAASLVQLKTYARA